MLKLANEKYKYAGYPLDSNFLKAATLESIIELSQSFSHLLMFNMLLNEEIH